MTINKLDFNSITGDKDVDQARALRLVLAVLEDDLTQLAAVSADVHTDKRGPEICVWELVIGMAGNVAQNWATHLGKETVADDIRAMLLYAEGAKNV